MDINGEFMKKFIAIVLCSILLLGGCNLTSTNSDDIAERLNDVSFTVVDGYYTRIVQQDEDKYVELFIPEKDSFVRILSNDIEQEVYSYNYMTTEFTYIYYMGEEKVIKVVYDIDDDEVIEDDDSFSDLLKEDALELKIYFESLIQQADIKIEEL